MDQPRRGPTRFGIGAIGLASTLSCVLLLGTFSMSGCGSDQGSGMVENPTDPTKTTDAQDSMKAYMKGMQTKGMKPGMKSAAPSK